MSTVKVSLGILNTPQIEIFTRPILNLKLRNLLVLIIPGKIEFEIEDSDFNNIHMVPFTYIRETKIKPYSMKSYTSSIPVALNSINGESLTHQTDVIAAV